MEEEMMTILDVLKETRKILVNIKVHVLDAESIGVPVANAVQNISVVIEAMENNMKENPGEGERDE